MDPVAKTSITGYPSLKPAFILKLVIGTGNPVGDVLSGAQLTHWETPTGTLTTADGFEPNIEAEVIFGADWLYVDRDKQYARPNVKCIAKTNDGHIVAMDYTGVAKLGTEGFQILAGDPNAHTLPFGLSATAHKFQTGAEKYKFLENSVWVGNGRFVVSNDPRTITVESRISQVVASTDMD